MNSADGTSPLLGERFQRSEKSVNGKFATVCNQALYYHAVLMALLRKLCYQCSAMFSGVQAFKRWAAVYF